MNINICRGCETVKHCMDSKVKVCDRVEVEEKVIPYAMFDKAYRDVWSTVPHAHRLHRFAQAIYTATLKEKQ